MTTLHEADKCVITNKGVTIVTGFVNIFEGNKLEIKLNKDIKLIEKEILDVYIYNPITGESLYEAEVASYENKAAVFTNVKHIRTMQKRNNVRIKTNLKYKIFSKCGEDGTPVELEKPVDVSILNISATGMLINQIINTKDDEPLYEQFKYIIKFKELKSPIDIVFRIVRKKEYYRSYRYGCEFEGLSQRQSDDIYKYILNLQIEELKGKVKLLD